MKRLSRVSGFTLIEILAAVVVLGIVSIGAARLYTTTFGVQHKLSKEFDLQQAAQQVLNEMGRGFTVGELEYGGVHGATSVEIQISAGPLTLFADDIEIIYSWDQHRRTLNRSIDGDFVQVVLEHVGNFHLSCSTDEKFVQVHLEMAIEGALEPHAKLDASLRPRVAELQCH